MAQPGLAEMTLAPELKEEVTSLPPGLVSASGIFGGLV